MVTYFTRRLLLVPVTFLVITFMVYSILRVVPGGPIEQAENQLRAAAAGEAGGGTGDFMEGEVALDEAAKEELRRYYNLDRAIPVGYLQWLGVWLREHRTSVTLDERRAEPALWGDIETRWRDVEERRETFERRLNEQKLILKAGVFYRAVEERDRRAAPDFFARADELLAEGVASRPQLEEHLEERDCRLIRINFFIAIGGEEMQSDSRLAPVAEAAAKREAEWAVRCSTSTALSSRLTPPSTTTSQIAARRSST